MPRPEPLRDRLLQLVKLRGIVAVDEATDAVGRSKNAVRAQLLNLEDQGVLQRVREPVDRPGRPRLAFRLTSRGHAMFPQEDAALLTALLRWLADHEHGAVLEAFFADRWASRRRAFLDALSQRAPIVTARHRLQVLRETLEREHFMPVLRHRKQADGTRRVTLRECNCPFPAAVAATRLPCRAEREFLTEALGVAPHRVRYATPSQPGCTFEFEGVPEHGG